MAILNSRTAATVLNGNDLFHIVDLDDPTDDPINGTSKKVPLSLLQSFIGGGGVSDYVSLTDTPGAYTGDGDKFLRVNTAENAVEHVAASTIGLSSFNNDAGFVASNLTHTGEVTGAGTLTVDSTAISNKALIAAAAGMEVLVNDSGTLKKVNANDFLGGGGGGIYSGSGSLTGNTTVTTGGFYTSWSGAGNFGMGIGTFVYKLNIGGDIYATGGIGLGKVPSVGHSVDASNTIRTDGDFSIKTLGSDFVLLDGTDNKTGVRVGKHYFSVGAGSNSFIWYAGSEASGTELARLEASSGNLGVGLTPTAGFRIHADGKIRTDSVFNVGGTDGFTGTGAYTNFTIVGGIITSAT